MYCSVYKLTQVVREIDYYLMFHVPCSIDEGVNKLYVGTKSKRLKEDKHAFTTSSMAKDDNLAETINLIPHQLDT